MRDSTVFVLPLRPDELERAIIHPASRADVRLEPGLASRIVADVTDEPGALPLLQYALAELYERRAPAADAGTDGDGGSGTMTMAAYEAMGGAGGALAARAEQLFVAADEHDQRRIRDLFTRLAGLGEGRDDVRRRVTRAELGTLPATEAVIEQFGAARLLSFDHDPVSREPTVEIAHEALLREWPRLRTWLEDDRDGLRLHRQLTEASRSWEGSGREAGDLYRGTRLDAALQWTEAGGAARLNPSEAAFVEASRQARDAEQTRLRRANRRLRSLVGAIGGALVVALVATAIAFVQRGRAHDSASAAEHQADVANDARANADVLRLTAESKVAQAKDLPLALLLAVEARQRADTPGTNGALESALASNPRLLRTVSRSWSTPSTVLTADGRELIAGQADGRIERTDTATLAPIGEPLQASSQKTSVAAGADDPDRFVSLDTDGTLVVWRRDGGREVSRRTVPEATTANAPAIALAPGGAAAFVGTASGVLIVPLDPAQPVSELLAGQPGRVQALALSPDRSRLAVAGATGTDVVVDLTTGRTVTTIATGLQAANIGSLSWSPDGSRVAQGNGGTSGPLGAIFDASTGQRVAGPFTEAPTPSGAFAGSIYAHCSSNGSVYLRNPATGAMLEAPFPAFVGICTLVPARDGTTLYVVGQNGISLVALDGRQKLGGSVGSVIVGRSHGLDFTLDPATGRVDAREDGPGGPSGPTRTVTIPDYRSDRVFSQQVDFSPDRTRLAAGSANGTVSILDASTGAVLVRFPMPFSPPDSRFFPSFGPSARNWVGFVRWSPDGRSLAVGSYDRVYLFNPDSGTLVREIPGWKDFLTSVEFSPDGTQLLVGSFDGTGKVVDVQTGQVVGDPLGTGNFSAAILNWTPDGGIVVVDNGLKQIRVLDAQTHQLRRAPFGNFSANLGVPHVTADGRRILVGSTDGLVRSFDLATGQEIGDGIGLPGRQVLAADRLGDAQAALLSVVDGKPLTTEWDLDEGHWQAEACAAAGRNLTQEEWDRYLPGAGPRRASCADWPVQP